MRFLNALLLLAALTTLALAWSKEDHELFRVRDELNALEGTDTSFYALLGVPPSAPLAEITKQNKKRSRQLHPDKAIPAMLAKRSAPAPRDPKDKSTGKKPGVTVTKGPSKKDREAVTREATARYQLYSVIVEILKGPQRERYDHFLRNGFPTWRGTGYYFKRYRPGLGTVLGGLLIVFGGAAHYFAMIVGYQRQRKFVEKYVERAKSAAWTTGVPGIPGAGSGVDTPPLIPDEDEGANDAGQMQMNRRQKRWQEKEDRKKKDSPAPRTARAARAVRDRDISRPVDGQAISGPAATKKRVQAENGKTLIVDSVGNVYLEETTEEGEVREFLLDPDEIPYPSFMQTALFRLPIFLYKQSIGRAVDLVRGTSGSEEETFLDDEGAELTTSAVDVDENGTLGAASAMNSNGDARNRRARVNGEK